MKRTVVPSLAAFSMALLACVPVARAMPPLGRQATGAVRDVNRPTQTLTIAASTDPQPRVYRWDERTRFVADGSFTTPAAIPRGATVAFTYHTPFIGEPFVTRVNVLHPLPGRSKASTSPLPRHARRPHSTQPT